MHSENQSAALQVNSTDVIGVLQITDTLIMGGSERVAVNLVNHLPRNRYRPYLCTTRAEGALAPLIARDVRQFFLARRHRFDIGAIRRLVHFIQAQRIQILHAHETSLFIAAVASLFPPWPAVVWHDHFGLYVTVERPVWLYRLATRRADQIIAVNQPLVEWARQKLGVPSERVCYIPNFVEVPQDVGQPQPLPGIAGKRIVCVANFRAQKDHFNLLRAMNLVVKQLPAAHLLLVGGVGERAYFESIKLEITRLGLEKKVSVLGERQDVYAILKGCDVGVLSSASEGLPLALLEYGMAGLPAVATRIGECAEVLDEGRVGILVPPGSHDQLAEALLQLLQSPERRSALGRQFHRRVQELHSPGAVVKQVCSVYETILSHVAPASRRKSF